MKRKLARIHHPVRRLLISALSICLSLLNWIGWRDHRQRNPRRRQIAGVSLMIFYVLIPYALPCEFLYVRIAFDLIGLSFVIYLLNPPRIRL